MLAMFGFLLSLQFGDLMCIGRRTGRIEVRTEVVRMVVGATIARFIVIGCFIRTLPHAYATGATTVAIAAIFAVSADIAVAGAFTGGGIYGRGNRGR